MLRNGKPYNSTASSAEGFDKYQILSTPTLQSTQHNSNTIILTDDSIVGDSEMERQINEPEDKVFRMPAEADAGNRFPLPAVPADVADVIPADDVLVPELYLTDNDGSALRMTQDKGDPLGAYRSLSEQTINRDMTMHSDVPKEPDPEMRVEENPFSWNDYLNNEGLASLLGRNAQPRSEEMDRSEPDKEEDGYRSAERYGMVPSPNSKKLIDRVEMLEE